MRGVVLSLCDRTGNMVRPWAEAGYQCYILDIQHPSGYSKFSPNVTAIGCSVTSWLQHEIEPFLSAAIAFAFPPCTNLAVSGSRWFKAKGLQGLIDGLTLVEACRFRLESLRCPWMIENPVSTLSTYWREPDHTFNPCDYGGYLTPPGDGYTKRTCLWAGNGFVLPTPKAVPAAFGSKMHKLPPSPHRADLRSETPMGFARAVFEANHDVPADLFTAVCQGGCE